MRSIKENCVPVVRKDSRGDVLREVRRADLDIRNAGASSPGFAQHRYLGRAFGIIQRCYLRLAWHVATVIIAWSIATVLATMLRSIVARSFLLNTSQRSFLQHHNGDTWNIGTVLLAWHIATGFLGTSVIVFSTLLFHRNSISYRSCYPTVILGTCLHAATVLLETLLEASNGAS